MFLGSVLSGTAANSTGRILSEAEKPLTLYHYTTEKGMNGILTEGKINASTKALKPKDARMGDGVYLSDIKPGTKNNAQLSKAFYNTQFQGNKLTNYVEISTKGLQVQQNIDRPNVYFIANSTAVKIEAVSFGKNWFK
jgi:hypothetical protein